MTSKPDRNLEGGCACGAVRYELHETPWDAGYCHCKTCRGVSGAPVLAFASVAPDKFVLTEGEDRVRSVRLNSFGIRRFCGDCGTPLTIAIDFQPETIDFTICSLDEPERVQPGFHIFTASRLAWFDTADALPRHEKFRPGTRGLEGTQPPA